eukprot:scaffold86_cov338-Pavlova_lutheri.AAC.116
MVLVAGRRATRVFFFLALLPPLEIGIDCLSNAWTQEAAKELDGACEKRWCVPRCPGRMLLARVSRMSFCAA